jgi:dienelactone hydrolase
MRAAAEVPFGAVVECAFSRPDVDHKHLILYGMSFGGYLTSGAAAHDPRSALLKTLSLSFHH